MLSWQVEEEAKYSRLYRNGYPAGRPLKCIRYFDIDIGSKLIDLGCGTGELSKSFKNYTGVDLSSYIIEQNKILNSGDYFESCLTDLSGLEGDVFDVGVCFDVLEHLPPDRVQETIESISKLSVGAMYFAICIRKSKKLDQEGNNLHLTIRNDKWWKNELVKHFEVETFGRWKDLVMCQCRN